MFERVVFDLVELDFDELDLVEAAADELAFCLLERGALALIGFSELRFLFFCMCNASCLDRSEKIVLYFRLPHRMSHYIIARLLSQRR